MSITIKKDEREIKAILEDAKKRYEMFKSQNLNLDMSRGKPCKEQLCLSDGLLNCLDSYKAKDGTDCRNYGGVDGIPEAKELFSQMLAVSKNEIIIGGNSSLNMMYDAIARAMFFGVYGGKKPWAKIDKVKFLCPSPGYDRHFAICELFGIEMITIEMKKDGPDIDAIEKLVAEDENIKGIWCVPMYSNPDGITYSDEVVERLASMKTKAEDFRIFWDNAYCVHHLSEEHDNLKNILEACKAAGNADRVYIFSSTSKITFPGAGVAMMAASENNINLAKKHLSIQTIGPDKLNQLRHVVFLKDMEGIKSHMKKHAEILKPKFDAVTDILEKELSGLDIAYWNKPKGGYFISLYTLPGCAREVGEMALKAGVTLTKVGATYPYGVDPLDRNIRIAPTFPPVDELKKAIEIVALCIKIVTLNKIICQNP